MQSFKETLRPIIPGLGLAVAVAVLARIGGTLLPQLGGSTLAILFGIVLGNTFFRQAGLAKGTKFAESKFLEYAVVLLGFTVTFGTISQIGVRGVLYVICMMSVTIGAAYWIGKKMGFSEKMTLLMAGGNAVCGSSAIGAIAPAIHADDEEKGQIITLVNLQGTVMMLTLPFLGLAVFGDHLLSKSALLGGTLQSVGQVVAGASLINPETVTYAMLFKITRILFLVVVVILFERKVKKTTSTAAEQTYSRKLPIPWYIIGFLIICIANSVFSIPGEIAETTDYISSWLEATALAAIGLRLDLSKFIKEGPRFIFYGLSVGMIQTAAAIALIFILGLI